MPNSTADNFAHGTYGDVSGVTFYGPPVKDFWEDSFAVSDRFIGPLFRAVLDRAQLVECAKVPRLVMEWNESTGWTDAAGIVELPSADAAELIDALTAVSEANLAPHLAEFAVTSEECLRCASAIAGFLRERMERGLRVYVERD